MCLSMVFSDYFIAFGTFKTFTRAICHLVWNPIFFINFSDNIAALCSLVFCEFFFFGS